MKAYIFLICLLIFEVNNLHCGDEDIEHCSVCNSETNINSCKTCEDNYFPFLENSLCIPCDHNIYGQAGCSGKCSDTHLDNLHNGNFKCDDECKKGYYKLNNTCKPCSEDIPYCGKCTYDLTSNNISCIECINNHYKLNNGKCYPFIILNCNEYNYDRDVPICDKCNQGFYIKNNQCLECYWREVFEGKICEICSDDFTNYEQNSCYCKEYYTEGVSKECIKCPDNCYNCGYKNNKLTCFNCDIGYTLNSKGVCVSCGENCDYCDLDINENPQCLFCQSNYKLNENHNCLVCGDNCESCIKDIDNNIICTKCVDKYGLNQNNECIKCPDNCNKCFWNEKTNEFGCSDCSVEKDIIGENDKCVSCQDIEEIGGNRCEECYYDKSSPNDAKYKCTACSDYSKYTFIENEYKCVDNTNSADIFFYGCLNATYNTDKNKYECLLCNFGYIYISDEKKCLTPTEINLNSNCSEAKNIGTEDNPKYTCLKCTLNTLNTYIKITDPQNIANCESPNEQLNNCLEANKDENENIECTKCNYNLDLYYDTTYNKNVCSKLCEDDSFFLYKSCFKCDDLLFGNPGCLSSSKCNIDTFNNHLRCNQCKEGYFKKNQECFPCSMQNIGCKKCSYSITDNFICEECFDGYILNSSKLCELKKCIEYPEISIGCLICEDKLKESKSKCESCKEDFFKTKIETCIYCKSDAYGGHGCEQCDYFDGEIKCSYCPEGSVLDNNRKCLKCEEELGEGCSNCKYIFNEEDKKNKLICTECIDDYYLSSSGHCIYPKNYAQYIPNCDIVSTNISNIDTYSINMNNNNGYEIKSQDYEINSFCLSCKEGYYKINNECIKLDIDNCTFSSILSDYFKNDICYDYLYSNLNRNRYTMIYYYIDYPTEITTIDPINKINIIKDYYEYNLYDVMRYLSPEIFKSINKNFYMFLGNLGTGDKNNPINLKHCTKALYYKKNDTYECTQCLYGYILDKETKICIQEIKYINKYSVMNCDFENIGTPSEPLYSCTNCHYYNHILVKTERGAKFCVNNNEIEGCTEVIVNTNYINNIYDCKNCSRDYILYKSKFYDRNICQNINSDIKRTNMYDFCNYSMLEIDSIKAENGECKNKKLFTPDNINCYECKSKNVGMPGCKGKCTFSLKRENPLECEDNGCKTGYIEITKGICETCNKANEGCIECHYDNNYPINYKGIKRKRRFVCDLCQDGYLLSNDGKCYDCYDYGLYGCIRCELDKNKYNEVICSQCYPGYFVAEDGSCIACYDNKVRVKGNKCSFCNNTEYGGIEGCISCKSNNYTILGCEKCAKGFILFEKNKTCLKISDNSELENYPNCQILVSNNNKLECSVCANSYTKLNENNEDKCISSDKIVVHNTKFNKYCEIYINKGTKVNPNYSCQKCLDSKFLDYENQKLIKFIFKLNGTSFCDLYSNYDIGMCKEATIIEKENGIEYNCTECYEGYYLDNKISNLFYCKIDLYFFYGCLIENCKTCKNNKNNFCEVCYQPYESDSITGSCVKKTAKVPLIKWKAIYGLKMNQTNNINENIFYGPSLILVGITNSQINKGHTFSFYLSFELKKLLRNLDNIGKIKKVPMICQITEGVDESDDDINMVEYNCFGNMTKEESEELTFENSDTVKIEEDFIKNSGKLMPSNLNSMSLSNIKDKNKNSQFSLEQFLESSKSELDELKNQREKKDDNKKLFRYLLYGGGGAVFIIIIISIVLCVRKRKNQKMDRNFYVNQYNFNKINPALVSDKIHKKNNINKKPSKNKSKHKFHNIYKEGYKLKEKNETDCSKRKIIHSHKKILKK